MQRDLVTEAQNPASEAIDTLSTLQFLKVMNDADGEVTAAVEGELTHIADAVDRTVVRLESHGRLFYIGAGTSGRLGVLDASECPPTFNTPPELVQGIIAGGDRALRHSVERAEDDPQEGKSDLEKRNFSGGDVLVGIAASGRTPYVLGALEYARSLGALTIGLSCTPRSLVAEASDIAISPVAGPEILTGSTRMRAGTATKLVLNMISTGVMIRLGYVYGNLMVNVQPTNDKLTDRACRIITTITGAPYEEAMRLLKEAGSVRIAVLMREVQIPRQQAESLLDNAKGNLRRALRQASAG
jgi:N-acetylmuramic acid 6-phosphate etherase